MNRGAIYSADRTLRLTLTREWGDGQTCCYIGHNPSTAGHEADDPTSQAWVRHANFNGFSRYVAVNLYPFRAADVKACRTWASDPTNEAALLQNFDVVVAEAQKADRVVACWGALAEDPILVDEIIEAIKTGTTPCREIYCLGRTLAGDPKHAMARGKHRIARDQRFEIWRKEC